MNKNPWLVLGFICASAPLSAQAQLPDFSYQGFSGIKAAVDEEARASVAALSSDMTGIDALAATLSDARASLADKIAAVETVTSEELYHFEDWKGGLSPQSETQLVLSLKDVFYSAAPAADRSRAVMLCGRFGRRLRWAGAVSDAHSFLKDLALRSDPGSQGQSLPAAFGLAEMAKASPLKDLDFQYTERTVGAALELLDRYGTGINDRVSQEQLYGLLILNNYLEYHLRDNVLGNQVGGFMDRVDRMPAWPSGLAWRLEGALIAPAERDIERLYSPANNDYRGYFVATLIDLARVESMDYGTIARSRRLLRTMAQRRDPVPAIRWMLAPYGR